MTNQTKPVATIGLVIVQVAVFFILSFGGMTEDAEYMLQHGAMYVPHILEHGDYATLFTSMFLHFGFDHLMSNMLMMLVIGWNLEPIIGRVKLVIIFLLSGIGGNLLSMGYEIFRQDFAVSAGASGAIFGMTGALLCMAICYKGRAGNVTTSGMIFVIGLSLYRGFTEAGVDNAAHVGGLITGFLAALIFCRKSHTERGSFTAS